MPCPPSWEERMVWQAEAAAKRLLEEYPELYQQQLELKQLFKALNVKNFDLPEFEENPQFGEMPPSPTNWPSREEGKAFEQYGKPIIQLFAKLEQWLCKGRTHLMLELDKIEEGTDATYRPIIQKHIDLHKKHREEDRREALRYYQRQITWYRMKYSLEKYGSDEELAKMEAGFAEVYNKKKLLESYSIDQLIRDRSLTETDELKSD